MSAIPNIMEAHMGLQVAEVLRRLERDGVEVIADPPRVRLRHDPDYHPPAELLAELRAHKDEVLALLQTRCWHCAGTGKCVCSTCWHSALVCAACKGTGRFAWMVQ